MICRFAAGSSTRILASSSRNAAGFSSIRLSLSRLTLSSSSRASSGSRGRPNLLNLPAGSTNFSWALTTPSMLQANSIEDFGVVFNRVGQYEDIVTRTSSYSHCGTQTGSQTCTPGGASEPPTSWGTIQIIENSNSNPGATPGNPLGPTIAPTPDFPEPPELPNHYPKPRFWFRTPGVDADGRRANLGIGQQPVYVALPSGHAYVIEVGSSAPVIVALVVPELPIGGMSLHLFDGSADIKLQAGMVYDLPGVGGSALALLGDPLSLVVGLTFNTDDSLQLGDIFGAAYVLGAVPEPSTYALLLAGLAVVSCIALRRASLQRLTRSTADFG